MFTSRLRKSRAAGAINKVEVPVAVVTQPAMAPKKKNVILRLLSPRRSKSSSRNASTEHSSSTTAPSPPRDRHDTCLAARTFQENQNKVQPDATVPVAGPSCIPSAICPIARKILTKVQQDKAIAIYDRSTYHAYQYQRPQQQLAQEPSIFKHGVPRLPRGSLTNDKLPALDHALASVVLQKYISREQDEAQGQSIGQQVHDTNDEVEQLVVADSDHSASGQLIIATVPILPKTSHTDIKRQALQGEEDGSSSTSSFEEDSSSSSSTHHHGEDSREGSVSTRATSERADESVLIPGSAFKPTIAPDTIQKAYNAKSTPRISFSLSRYTPVPEEKERLLGSTPGYRFSMGDRPSELMPNSRSRLLKRWSTSRPSGLKSIDDSTVLEADAASTMNPRRSGVYARDAASMMSPRRSGVYARDAASMMSPRRSGAYDRDAASTMSPRRSGVYVRDAKRLSLLALNALGGHAPQAEY